MSTDGQKAAEHLGLFRSDMSVGTLGGARFDQTPSDCYNRTDTNIQAQFVQEKSAIEEFGNGLREAIRLIFTADEALFEIV
ncbi:MAG: hypothetical protein EHM79_21100, partial [Geobacter sp.]